MKNLNVSAFKTKISAYLRRVEAGEEFIITDHKRPVAVVRQVDRKSAHVKPAEVPFSLPEKPDIGKKKGLASQLIDEERGTE